MNKDEKKEAEIEIDEDYIPHDLPDSLIELYIDISIDAI